MRRKNTRVAIVLDTMGLVVAAGAFTMLLASVAAVCAETAAGPACAWQVRDGCPRVFAKLSDGKPVTVVYLGGSITQAPDGWAARTTRALQARFPAAAICGFNAGLSGTGADLGAARVAGEVIAHHPDLVFVEFAVNGGDGGVRDGMARTTEGIVRQILRADMQTDIVFMHTVATWFVAGFRREGALTLPSTSLAMERVAAHYHLPAIFTGIEVAAREKAGGLDFQGTTPAPGRILFSRDGVHPTADGAQFYAEIVMRALTEMGGVPPAAPRAELPEPLDPANWEQVRWLDLTNLRRAGPWREVRPDPAASGYGGGFADTGYHVPGLRARFPLLLAATAPDATLEFSFTGTVLGFIDVGGPFSGQLRVAVDDRPEFLLSRFSRYNSTVRPQYGFLPELPQGRHQVRLTLAAAAPDKSAVPESRAGGAYLRNEFYLGGVFVVDVPAEPATKEMLDKPQNPPDP